MNNARISDIFRLFAVLSILALFAGCEGSGSSSSYAKTEGTVGTAGGTITGGNNAVTLVFPAGALTADTAITVTAASNYPAATGLVNGTAFDFGPEGTTFLVPVTLTIKYNTSNLPQGIDESTLKINKLISGVWTPVAGSTVDTTAKTVSAQLNGFSTYAVLGEAGGGSSSTDTNGVAYAWHTFYGTDGTDSNYAYPYSSGAATDKEGNVYVSGTSWYNFTGPNGEQPRHAISFYGTPNVFVMKLDKDGNYQWHTFYGPSGSNQQEVRGGGIVVDSTGNSIYVTGTSWTGSSPWSNTTAGLHFPDHTGNRPIFLMKLSSSGDLAWYTIYSATIFGSPGGSGITLDKVSGNIIITANANSNITGSMLDGNMTLLPVTPYSDPAPNGQHYTVNNPLVMEFNPSGLLLWYTFLGPNFGATGITSGMDGSVYLSGTSGQTWNDGSTTNPFSGTSDLTVVKLAGDGSYAWNTFYGPNVTGGPIAVDDKDYVYVLGHSKSSLNGPAGEQPLNGFSGTDDLVLLKLSDTGQYKWHTFYPSASENYITIDSAGNVLIAGGSTSSWNGPAGQAPIHAFLPKYYSSNGESFVLSTNSDGAYRWHTFGGLLVAHWNSYDLFGGAFALNTNGDLYFAGSSEYPEVGPDGQAPLKPYAGNDPYYVSGSNHTNILIGKLSAIQ